LSKYNKTSIVKKQSKQTTTKTKIKAAKPQNHHNFYKIFFILKTTCILGKGNLVDVRFLNINDFEDV